MAYKAPEIIPGFRAEDPDMIHVIDQIGVLIKEVRLATLISMLEYNAKIATIFNSFGSPVCRSTSSIEI